MLQQNMLVTEKYTMDNGRDHAIAAGCLQLIELTHTFYMLRSIHDWRTLCRDSGQ